MPYKDKNKHREACRRNYHKNKVRYLAVQQEYYKGKRRVKGVGFIDREIFNSKFLEQNGKCAICKRDLALEGMNTNFDHNHTTLKLRGILCSNCNLGLGQFKENGDFLLAAIAYLEEYK